MKGSRLALSLMAVLCAGCQCARVPNLRYACDIDADCEPVVEACIARRCTPVDEADAGAADSGASDSGVTDGGMSDGGLSDGGASDGGISDAGPVCGNTVTELPETCDDGNLVNDDDCDSNCTIEACGNGIVTDRESCDDGNITDGDGCSMACGWEALLEREPNETTLNSLTVLVPGTIRGNLIVGDVDTFTLEVPTAGVVQLETFGTDGKTCSPATVSEVIAVTVFADAGTLASDDAGSGIGNCGSLTVHLDAGSYFAQLSGPLSTPSMYLLQYRLIPDGRQESEPNDVPSTATPLAVPPFQVTGTLLTNESDWYSFDLPWTTSVRVETIEGDRATESCELNQVDTAITVIRPDGGVIGDDDSGRGTCSMIDGTDQLSPGSNLPAGHYYVRVTGPASGAPFSYRLSVLHR